jgi:large subunit ribosomal protein L9
MSSTTQVILLERVEKLGELGDIVNVKPGFARNYLLPQKKAMRANKENLAYFEAQKKVLQDKNDEQRTEAQKLAKKIEGVRVSIIRQASEAGQLFGSVATRDIADAVCAETKEVISRSMVDLNQNIKTIGLIPVTIILHPEVKVEVIVNIARSVEEAKIQAKSGYALVASRGEEALIEEAPVEEVSEESTTVEEALVEVAPEAEEAPKEKKAKKSSKKEKKAE